MNLTLWNDFELQMESKSMRDSWIRFVLQSSTMASSYAPMSAMKIILCIDAVKYLVHIFRTLWTPPGHISCKGSD